MEELVTRSKGCAGQAAAAGLARGITVSKGTGLVSEGIQPISGLENWGAWNETEYGIRFATTAKIVGSGCMLLWYDLVSGRTYNISYHCARNRRRLVVNDHGPRNEIVQCPPLPVSEQYDQLTPNPDVPRYPRWVIP